MIAPRKNIITIPELELLPMTKAHRLGALWKGVPYADVIEGISQAMEAEHWLVSTTPILTLTRCQSKLCGGFKIAKHNQTWLPPGYVWGIGFSACYTGRERLKLYSGFWAGRNPIACIAIPARKTTHAFDPGEAFPRLFETAISTHENLSRFLRKLMGTRISREIAERVIHASRRASITTNSRALRSLDAWLRLMPTDRTAANLLLEFQKINQFSPPDKQMGRSVEFWKLLSRL